jgi:hypothetical protein
VFSCVGRSQKGIVPGCAISPGVPFLRERKRTARLHRAAKARSRAGCTSRHGRGFSDIVLIGERSCRQAIIIKRGDGNDGFSRKGICPGGHGSPGFRGPLSVGAVDGPGAVGDSGGASLRMSRGMALLSGVFRLHAARALGGHAGASGLDGGHAPLVAGDPFRQRTAEKMEKAVDIPFFPGSSLDPAGARFMTGFSPGIIGEKKGGRPLPELRIPDVGSPEDPEIHTPREPEIASPGETEIASPRDPEPESEPNRREPERR